MNPYYREHGYSKMSVTNPRCLSWRGVRIIESMVTVIGGAHISDPQVAITTKTTTTMYLLKEI